MVVTAPAFKAVAVCEEAPSTSCTEGDVPSHEPSVKSRSLWKAAVVATTVALIAGAGTSWARKVTEGEEVTALEGTEVYHSYPTIGCSNWKSIQFSSTTVADKAACQTLCTSDALCTSFGWQAAACAPGVEGVGPNTCLIFHGSCQTERNTCWDLVYRTSAATITVSQTLTVDADGPEADIRAGVEAAFAAEGVEGVTVEPTPAPAGRRMEGGRRLGFWSFVCKVVTKIAEEADKAYERFVAIAENPDENKKFTAALKDNVGESVTVNGDTCAASPPTVEKEGEEARPGCATESESCAEKKCCAEPGLFCYEKDEYWAGCRPSCNVGIHEYDVPPYNTPWSCNVLDTTGDAPDPTYPPSTTEAEPEAETTVKAPACAPNTWTDCRPANCCEEEGLYCYGKDPYWASCMASCTIGIHENDDPNFLKPWACTKLDEDPNAPDPIEPTPEFTTS